MKRSRSTLGFWFSSFQGVLQLYYIIEQATGHFIFRIFSQRQPFWNTLFHFASCSCVCLYSTPVVLGRFVGVLKGWLSAPRAGYAFWLFVHVSFLCHFYVGSLGKYGNLVLL